MPPSPVSNPPPLPDAPLRAPFADAGPAWSRNKRIVAGLVGFVWLYTGGNYLAFKVASAAMSPLLVATLRFGLAALVLLPLAARRWGLGARPTGRELAAAAVLGLVMLVLGQGLAIAGTHLLPAGVAAVFGASSPLFLALLAWTVLKRPLARAQVAGILLGFGGLSLMAVGAFEHGGLHPLGIGLLMGAGLSWSGGSLLSNRLSQPADAVVGLFVQLSVATLAMLLPDLLSGALARTDWAAVPVTGWLAVGFLGLVSTALGYAAFLQLNRHVSPATANSFSYAAPVIALALSALLLGERLTPVKLAAAAVALAGVAVMVAGGGRRRTVPRMEPDATG